MFDLIPHRERNKRTSEQAAALAYLHTIDKENDKDED